MATELLSNVLNAGRIFLLGADASPIDGCELVISLSDDDDLLLVEREIRGEFQSPPPNFERRGEFQSPRLNHFVNANHFVNTKQSIEPIPYFTQEIIESDHPKIICPNPLRSNAKLSDAKRSDAKRSDAKRVNKRRSETKPTLNELTLNELTVNALTVNALTVNTSITNMYHDAILTDIYDDNSYE
jgi:hypothetical protein